ncbi:MAG: hypothetical protein GYA51_14300 [Candidatus Methanofastidiosa archaeon]|nr:hypothetical protein [Candidatus Methanofastidiosa archaeon]
MDNLRKVSASKIDVVWQYSKFYGKNLFSCEDFYCNDRGYIALILLFETIENVCKSIVEDYDLSFYKVVQKLGEMRLISEQEECFLSTDEFSVRKIRNLFAHADLSSIGFFENGIYYSLVEEESCMILYRKVFTPSLNMMVNLIKKQS